MKKLLTILLSMSVLLGFSPFIGIDLGQSRLKLHQKFGEKIFRKNASSYNFFGGINFNEHFGMELGYQRDNARKDKQSLVEGDFIPGTSNAISAGASPAIFDTLLKHKNKYLGATAQYQIYENLNISMLLGIARNTIKAMHTLKSNGTKQYDDQDIQNYFFFRSYKKSKIIPMVRLGARYKIHENFSFRANLTWTNTSRIRIDSDQNGSFSTVANRNVSNNNVRLKNSINYGVGIVTNF